MVPTSCSCSGPTAAHVAVALSGQPRWCGSVGPRAATQSVKWASTASSGGASPGSGSDGSSVVGEVPLLISAIYQRRGRSRALVVQFRRTLPVSYGGLPLLQAFR
jgi:hypothetical protein